MEALSPDTPSGRPGCGPTCTAGGRRLVSCKRAPAVAGGTCRCSESSSFLELPAALTVRP